MEKQYKAAQDKKGNPIMVEMTQEEIAQQEADRITSRNWHNSSKPIRVILSLECLRLLNAKKEFNEKVNQLYNYFKSNDLQKVEFNDSLYIYLDELYPEHRVLIEQNRGVVETKV